MKAAEKAFVAALLLGVTFVLGGCATIVGDEDQLIPIGSDPDFASVVIVDESGRQVFSGTTPTSVTLQKSDGSYWGKKSYTLTVTRPGYASRTIPITARANGWYIAGNLVFGGLIGWFIVDPFNGGMYTLTPKHVEAELGRQAAREERRDDNGIRIVLIEDVPPALRAQMEPFE